MIRLYFRHREVKESIFVLWSLFLPFHYIASCSSESLPRTFGREEKKYSIHCNCLIHLTKTPWVRPNGSVILRTVRPPSCFCVISSSCRPESYRRLPEGNDGAKTMERVAICLLASTFFVILTKSKISNTGIPYKRGVIMGLCEWAPTGDLLSHGE